MHRLTVGAIAVLAAAAMAPSPEVWADAASKQAKQEMDSGYQAARRGYWREAAMRFERANQLTPGQPKVLNNLAVALEATGRYEEALVTYETALTIAPNDRNLTRNMRLFREFYRNNIADPEPDDADGASEQTTDDTTDTTTDTTAGDQGSAPEDDPGAGESGESGSEAGGNDD